MKSTNQHLRGPVYRYNPESCRYERARPGAGAILFYATGILITSSLIFAGLLILHNIIVDSPREKLLRRENLALQKSAVLLTSHLADIGTDLTALREKDENLHQKFFNSPASYEPRQAHAEVHATDWQGLQRETVEQAEEAAMILKRSREFNNSFFPVSGSARHQNVLALPASSPVLSLEADQILSGFGPRVNPYHKGVYQHNGIDISLPRGTQIVSPGDGVVANVKFSSLQAGYGNYLEVDHGAGFVTRFAHLDDIVVRKGDKVVAGTVLGLSGNSGGSVAPHLHYEILKDGLPVDPILFIVRNVTAARHESYRQSAEKQNQSLD